MYFYDFFKRQLNSFFTYPTQEINIFYERKVNFASNSFPQNSFSSSLRSGENVNFSTLHPEKFIFDSGDASSNNVNFAFTFYGKLVFLGAKRRGIP